MYRMVESPCFSFTSWSGKGLPETFPRLPAATVISCFSEKAMYLVLLESCGKYCDRAETIFPSVSDTLSRPILSIEFCCRASSTASGSVSECFTGSAEASPPPARRAHAAIATAATPRFRERDLTTTKRTGMIRSVKNIEKTRPKAMTLARGLQRLDPERIIGVTPTAAAIVVRKIGRSRRAPASCAACSRGSPSATLSLQ
jgi:hypothetical protein